MMQLFGLPSMHLFNRLQSMFVLICWHFLFTVLMVHILYCSVVCKINVIDRIRENMTVSSFVVWHFAAVQCIMQLCDVWPFEVRRLVCNPLLHRISLRIEVSYIIPHKQLLWSLLVAADMHVWWLLGNFSVDTWMSCLWLVVFQHTELQIWPTLSSLSSSRLNCNVMLYLITFLSAWQTTLWRILVQFFSWWANTSVVSQKQVRERL